MRRFDEKEQKVQKVFTVEPVRTEKKSAFKFIDHLNEFPPFIARNDIEKYFPFVSKKTLANRKSLGMSVPKSVKCLNSVVYETKSFLEWLDSLTEEVNKEPLSKSDTKIKTPRRGRKTKLKQVQERRGNI
ncbi:hypothetical protein [Malonomonas rubra]|uniref:hypothetical protein n=1 Tax=Malonomonas rubra TaxID=57040 RepID=UPI0011149AD5|nr:hypothetical protein [Malonomonas rubra]